MYRKKSACSWLSKVRNFAQSGICFVLPSLLGVLVFIAVPFADVARRSFVEAVSGSWAGIQNYRTVFSNEAFQLAAVNTLRFEAVCIPLLLVLSLGTALLLDFLGRHLRLFKSCFLLPMAIPTASAALLWKVLFHEKGIFNGLLDAFHLKGTDWLGTDWAFWILVFSYIWKNLGYDLVLWLAGLSGISPNLYEAAQVDGAGRRQCFWYITVPQLLPSFYTIGTLSILNSFKAFREAYLAAGDYPHESMYLLQHLFNNWYRDLSMDKMAAGAVVQTGVIFLLVLLLEKVSGDRCK